MKKLFLIALLTFSTSVFSIETLKGTFEINGIKYELNYSYDIPLNQIATSQNVRVFDNVILPDQAEPMPAYCALEMTFPASVKVVIKETSTAKAVYMRDTIENLFVNSYLGMAKEGQCSQKISDLKEKLRGNLRVVENILVFRGKTFRYVMDTYLSIQAYGTADDLVFAKNTMPVKGSDGRKDGEVWLDTQPAQDGSYDRTWFTLSL